MGTSYQIKWDHRGVEVSVENIADNTQLILSELNQLMSTYLDNSELSQFNQTQTGVWFQLSPDTAEVIGIAIQVSKQSEGAFDITVGDLVNLWGFGPDFKPVKLPKDEQVNQVLSSVGYQYLSLDKNTGKILKQKPVYVDLSAVAKGYAVDKVAEYLQSVGVSAYLVEVGGELRSFGRKPDGSAWRVAIESPVAGNPVAGNPVAGSPVAGSPASGQRSIHNVIELENSGLATSGDYRNFYEEDGVRYSHTIDPRTGRPITHRLASVTVLHEQTSYADAWATALMVMGEEQGYDLAVKNKLAAFFIAKETDVGKKMKGGKDGGLDDENQRFTERVTPEFTESFPFAGE